MTILLPSEGTARASDQRRDERYGFRLPVTLLRGREEVPLATEDVSYHGLFLDTEEPPPLRHLVRMRVLIPPYHRELQVFGMTVHHAGGPARRGAGVQLYALDRAARTIWGNFVTRVRLGDFEKQAVAWSELADGGIRFLPPEIVGEEEAAGGDVVWLDGTKSV
jgi:hypothetical protein